MTTTMFIWAGAAAVAAGLYTPLVAVAARAANLLDVPGPRKVHQHAVPRLGGLALVTALAAALTAAAIFDPAGCGLTPLASLDMIALLVPAFAVFLIGLVDDIRGLRAIFKLAGQTLAALVVCLYGIRIESISFAPGLTVHLGLLSLPVTLGWILLVTNAVNLIDGLDGLAGGICAIASAALAVFALCTGQLLLAALMLALFGSLLGFLVFNVYPARIFLGDGGSMFLGFLLASASAASTVETGDFRALAIAALALGVPVLDAMLSIFRRLLERHSLFAPDRGHIHHRLLHLGHTHPHAVNCLLTITAAVSAMALGSLLVPRGLVFSILLADAAVLLCCVVRMLRLDPAQVWQSILRNFELARCRRMYTRTYELSLLRLRESTSFDQWWRAVCLAADEMGLKRVSLDLEDRNRTCRRIQWTRRGRVLSQGALCLSLAVRHRRSGPPLQLEIEIPVTGATESVGLQASIFGRLVDEFSLADLPARGAGRAFANVHAGAA